jgi:hypothetical protein
MPPRYRKRNLLRNLFLVSTGGTKNSPRPALEIGYITQQPKSTHILIIGFLLDRQEMQTASSFLRLVKRPRFCLETRLDSGKEIRRVEAAL